MMGTVMIPFILGYLHLFGQCHSSRVTLPMRRHDLAEKRRVEIVNTFTLASGIQAQVALTNNLDRIYTGGIAIGDPQIQEFSVVFDTGSADLWVFSQYNKCQTCPVCQGWNDCCTNDANDACCYFQDVMSSYDHNLSNQYKKYSPKQSWKIQYGKGAASGYLSQDVVTIGNLQAELTFAEATWWSDDLISCEEPMDGILGFAMKAASESGASTLTEALYKSGQIDRKMFSFKLDSGGGLDGSVLVIGEPDDQFYSGDIIYGDVIQPESTGMWFTQFTGVLYNDNVEAGDNKDSEWIDTCINDNPCLALVDSGTSYITMPNKQYRKLINHLDEVSNSACKTVYGQYICPIDRHGNLPSDLPNLFFQLNGHAFRLTPNEYFISDSCTSGGNWACLGIASLNGMGAHTYIFGDTFLRQYYAVFDESDYKVGFGSNEEVYKAQSRPDDSKTWRTVEIIALAVGCVGVLGCVTMTCVKYRRPKAYPGQTVSNETTTIQNPSSSSSNLRANLNENNPSDIPVPPPPQSGSSTKKKNPVVAAAAAVQTRLAEKMPRRKQKRDRLNLQSDENEEINENDLVSKKQGKNNVNPAKNDYQLL